MTRTFLPCARLHGPGHSGRVGSVKWRSIEWAPDQGTERLQFDPTSGSLVGAGGVYRRLSRVDPRALGFPARDDVFQSPEDGEVAIGVARERLEQTIGFARLLFFPAGVKDFDFCREGGHLIGVLFDGLPRRWFRQIHSCGRPDGRGPERLGPHRSRLGELIECRADFAACQQFQPFQLGEEGLRLGTRMFFQHLDLLDQLGLVILPRVRQPQGVRLSLLLEGDVRPIEGARSCCVEQFVPELVPGQELCPASPTASLRRPAVIRAVFLWVTRLLDQVAGHGDTHHAHGQYD